MKRSINGKTVWTDEFAEKGESVAVFCFSQKGYYNAPWSADNKVKESSLMACGGGGFGGRGR